MTKDLILHGYARPEDTNLDKLRKGNKIPGVVYGHGFKNQNVSVDYLKFEKCFKEVGESSLFNLNIDNTSPLKVIVKSVNTDPVSGRFIHVDFYQVRMDEKVTAEVPLEFVGESNAVKNYGGILIKNFDSLEIECLPADLISKIEVDLEDLKELGSVIRIKDLKVPNQIKLTNNPEDAVVLAEEPRLKVEENTTEKVEESVGKKEAGDQNKLQTDSAKK